ncbi:MAG: CT583 family protein [Simkania sp.]|nr:CT583 family protein [Simkania sp.]
MTKVNPSLAERFKLATAKLSRITKLSDAVQGSSNISQVFKVAPLSTSEQNRMSQILDSHCTEEQETTTDLRMLSDLTAEIKAINSQAAILHGERIKQAQEILKKYRDGAFTAWLIAAYGNRQTPYNFLQYYELHRAIPQTLSCKLDEMPRQLAYTLASRNGSIEQKVELIKNYKGQSKDDVLSAIRSTFPLSLEDKRAHDPIRQIIETLRRVEKQITSKTFSTSEEQKEALQKILYSMQQSIL